ncbi:MAG: hypothetical protein HY653_08110, partial [Acidobacteria bacterium]|nr:hypothetical protein [Acidobacteriota bacterium]
MKKKRGLVLVLLGVLLLVGVPLAGSVIGLRGSVERAFERHWGRPVEISRAEVRLLPEPSLRAYGVKLVEWEEFGAEPFMHVEEARCRVKLAALLRGRLECARLHFLRPSLNVVRNHEGAWNLLRWLEGAGEVWPVLTAEEARINFKQGAEKKVYALAEARFALEVKPEAWHIDLEARPFRSDRRLRETGRIRLNGTWKRTPDETGSSPLALSWEVERSALSQWVAFFTGHEPPVRANVALTGNVTGSVAALRLAGECTVEDLRRWDLIPPRPVPRWRGSYELRFSPMTRELGILRADLRSEGSSISARGRIENLLAEPRWDVEVTSSLALDELLAQLGALRTGVSPDTRLQGTTEVTATLAGTTSEWKGTMTLAKPALWRLPDIRETVRVEPTEMRWQGDRVDLDPLRLVFPGERTLELGGRLLLHEPNWFARVRAHTEQMDLEHLRAAARAVGWNLWGETQWRGRARLALEWRGNVSAWSERMRRGRLELEQASFQAPALNGSLEIEKA